MRRNLVILPGWRQNSDHWQVAISKLKTYCSVYFIDLPGFGKEKLVDQDWEIGDDVNWVEEKIAKLSLKKIVLLGHSFGGRLAIDIASKKSSWQEGLILYASPCFSKKKKLADVASFLSRILPVKFKSDLARLISSDDYLAVKGTGLEKVFCSVVNYDQSSKLGHIKVPTMILWGDKDQEASVKVGEKIKQMVNNSKLVVIKGAGHNIHINQPNIFYGKIKQYLGSF